MEKSHRSCSYCYKKLEKALQCSACNSRAYCGRDCQKLDWKQHKIWCGCGVAQIDVDFEVRTCAFGMGVFAKRSFTMGEKIVTERAVIKLSEDEFHVHEGRNFKFQFDMLPSSVKEAIIALYPPPVDPSVPSVSVIGGREVVQEETHSTHALDAWLERVMGPGVLQYKYNSFSLELDDTDNAGVCGLFVTASRFNHACVPNCGRGFVSDHNLMVYSYYGFAMATSIVYSIHTSHIKSYQIKSVRQPVTH